MSNVARVAGQAANTLSKPLNVEEVFSTYLYTGTGSTLNIVNGIDLDGEGGLTWIKARNIGSASHALFDTERGGGSYLNSNETLANETPLSAPLTFNSDGFTINTQADMWNGTYYSNRYTSWTFRKAPKFFDVVTYTGDGVAGRTVSHNLGSVPGCIITKRTDSGSTWAVYHRGVAADAETDYLRLDTTSAAADLNTVWNDTAPTSTDFTLGSVSTVNASGGTYVAYLFAHNDGDGGFGPDGDADIIKCGSYTGTGSSGNFVDLGFEPQFMLIKNTSSTANWIIHDNMRGMIETTGNVLFPNLTAAENTTAFRQARPNATGITFFDGNSETNGSGSDYIYIAIRRGPMAVPESATDVFDVKTSSSSSALLTSDTVTTDALLHSKRSTSAAFRMHSRLTGQNGLTTYSTAAESDYSTWLQTDEQTGFELTGFWSTNPAVYYSWKRAPNYFDVVAYTGDGTNGRAISHNLGVAPEMMWVRVRNAANDWVVYHKDLGEDTILRLNSTSATISKNVFSSNTPTDSVFYVQGSAGYDVNYSSSQTYIAYLFASLDGVSKVGSFTTTGSDVNVDCGFSAGPRFVLIKNTASGNWFVMDTERGITSGTDPFLTLNTTNAESSALDLIDINPTSTGFTVNQGSFGNGTFIFYAIA